MQVRSLHAPKRFGAGLVAASEGIGMPDNLTPDGPEWAEFEPRDPNKFYVRYVARRGNGRVDLAEFKPQETRSEAEMAAKMLHDSGADVVGIIGPFGFMRIWSE